MQTTIQLTRLERFGEQGWLLPALVRDEWGSIRQVFDLLALEIALLWPTCLRKPIGWLLAFTMLAGLAGCAATDPSVGLGRDAITELSHEPLAATEWRFGQAPGTLITTPHYRLYTTIQNPLYQRLMARMLEACFTRFTELNPANSINHPMDCYVFADRDAWELYTKLRAGSNAPVYLQISAGGYCQEGVFAGYDIGREQTLSVLSHEAWHQFSWFTFKDRLPSWLEEGLATQNEAIVWDSTTPTFAPELNYRRFQALQAAQREVRLWKLSDLLNTHAGRVIKMPPKYIDAYYAQLWALVLFLEHSPYRNRLADILRDAQTGELAHKLADTGLTSGEINNFTEHWNSVAGPTYLMRYINPDLNKLETQYRRFIRDLTDSWPPHVPNAD